MADGHTDTSSASNVSDLSSNFHCEGNSFDFEQYLSYNADKEKGSKDLMKAQSLLEIRLSKDYAGTY